MGTDPNRRRGRVIASAVLGTVVGLVIAVIVVLNLHILVGLEEGYASTPAQVAEFSTVLIVVDVVLTVGLPALGAWVATRLLARGQPVPEH